MTKTIFAGEKVENLRSKIVLLRLERSMQNSFGSLKISSWVIVQTTYAMGIAIRKRVKLSRYLFLYGHNY